MIPKIKDFGGGTYGLIKYLYGPGKHNEHTDQHMAASWNGFAPDPGPEARREDLLKLARQLDQPIKSLPASAKHPDKTVWHCSVRAADTDRLLTDSEWADIARRIVHAAGIAPNGDTRGCRWVAVRHAPDHIHIAATLVREDGRTARRSYDKKAVQREARVIEKDYGLRELNPGDGTSAQQTTSAEHFKAARLGLERPAREQLRENVHRALAGATNEEEFFHRLTAQGVRIKPRIAPSGDVIGYSVALPGDRNRDDKPIWYSGSKLAPDLSLPRIRKRFAAGTTVSDEPADDARPSSPALARRTGTSALAQAVRTFDQDDDAATADGLVGFGEVLDAVAQTASSGTRTELREAARSFERATRFHVQAENAHNQGLRRAAGNLVRSGPALGRGEDGGATAMILSTLVTIAIVAAQWHAARGHAQQAAAARETAAHLRAAYEAAALKPVTAMRQRGQQLPARDRQDAAQALHAVLPDQAARIQAEPNWPALAAALSDARQAGHDPAALLHRAVDERELDTADSLSEVLLWRLRHQAELPAAPTYPTQQCGQRPKPPPAATGVPLPGQVPRRKR